MEALKKVTLRAQFNAKAWKKNKKTQLDLFK
jgi:hypothetical protein